uniref:Ribosome-recycling factor, mitochondrial n=1 Tax=Elaeophora elaphi TaxID=1147741 RepID=A0A0R3RI14_9BILA
MFSSWQRFVNFQLTANVLQKHGLYVRPERIKAVIQATPYCAAPLCRLIQIRELHCSPLYLKKKRKSKIKGFVDDESVDGGDPAKAYNSDFVVRHGVKEMKTLEDTFKEELTKDPSLKVYFRTCDDFVVDTEDGKQHKLNTLGRMKLLNPQLVSVDFTDNPSVIKLVRCAIERSKLDMTVRQEGAVLYISLPRITRERRENMANVALKKLLNEYKKALNEVYSKYDRELEDHEEFQKIMQELLKEKRSLEKKAIMMIEERRNKVLTEAV